MPQRWIPTSRRDPGYMIDGRHELGSLHHEGSHGHQAGDDHHPQTAGGVSHHYHPGMSAHHQAGHGCGAGGGPHHGTVAAHVSPHHDPHPIREGEMSMFQHRVIPDRPHPVMVHQYHDMPTRSSPPPPPPHQHHHSLGPASHPHGNIAHHPCHDPPLGHPHHPSPQIEHSHPAIHHTHAPHYDMPLDPHPRFHSQHHRHPTPHSICFPHEPEHPLHAVTNSSNHTHHAGAHGPSKTEHEGVQPSHLHHPTYMHPTGYHLDYHPSHHRHPDHHHLIPHNHINRHNPTFHASHATLHPYMAYAPLDLSLYHHGYTNHYPHHHIHHHYRHHEPHHHDSHVDHVDHDLSDGAAASRQHHHDHTTAQHHHQHHVHFPEVDEHHYGDVSFGNDPTKFHVAIPLKPDFKPDDVTINVQMIDEKDVHVEFRHDHHDPRVQTSRILRHVLTLPHHVAVDSLKSTLNPHGVLVIEGLIKTSTNAITCHNIEVEVIEPQTECADDEKHVVSKEQKGSVEESE